MKQIEIEGRSFGFVWFEVGFHCVTQVSLEFLL